MKLKNNSLKKSLAIAIVMLTGILSLTSFLNKTARATVSDVKNKLTVTSAIPSKEESFDLVIIGKTSSGDPYSKTEKSINTPFELNLDAGQYSIVINRISNDGKIIGRIEQYVDDKFSASAQGDEKITVLVIHNNGDYAATGL